jgi:hypothetical protein
MLFEKIPVWGLVACTIVLVFVAHEVGHRLGRAASSRPDAEKESTTGAISGAILGLVAFMLAFTFGIAADRYDMRKALVREEANAIATAYLRTDFLPDSARTASASLYRSYVDQRVSAVQKNDLAALMRTDVEARRIHRSLWAMAVANGKRDLNSDVGALYIEGLNHVMEIHALRMNVGVQMRIPPGIWGILFALIGFSLVGVGYHTAVAGSSKSWMTLTLALSLATVVGLIAVLDRPQTGVIGVSQQPLIDVRDMIDADGRGK